MATKKTARRRTASDSKIPEQFQPLAYPLAKLKEDPHNAREHGERNLEAVRRSLERFGWRGVVVARRKDGVVLSGNARVRVARELGWQDAPVLFVDDDKRNGKAWAIADNRTAELAEWRLDELAKQVQELSGDKDLLGSIGFSEAEIENLLNAEPWDPDEQEEEEGDLDDHRRDPAKPKGDDSRCTLILTGAQLKDVLAALDVARKKAPKLTVGAFIQDLALRFAGRL